MQPDDPTTTALNGATPPTEEAAPQKSSLREIAEAAYDEVVEAADEQPEGEPSDQDGRARDDRGRFVAKPGEAAPQDGTQPREDGSRQPADQPHPAPVEGSSSEAPQNWKPEHRLMFSKLPAEAQAFLTERLSEVEGGLQRKIQANVQAAEFVSSIAPVFNHPALAASLQEQGFSPSQAVQDWASMHIRALSPNPQERMQLWMEMGQRMGLDPAALAPSRQGQNGQQLSEADLKDPAIRYFADHLGKVLNDQQALRGQLQSMQQQDAQRQSAEAMKVTRWGIDSFAEEKGSDGKPLRPDFDLVLPQIIELFRANPDRDLREAYETARWMRADTRDKLLQQQRSSVEQKQSDQRARQAVRSNARGLTSPVSKPAGPAGASSLRDVIENSADEVGF
jgi:hypothetical protein